jgi:hypothetical protein
MEKTSRLGRNLMKMAAVPKRIPAVIPSINVRFLVLVLNDIILP